MAVNTARLPTEPYGPFVQTLSSATAVVMQDFNAWLERTWHCEEAEPRAYQEFKVLLGPEDGAQSYIHRVVHTVFAVSLQVPRVLVEDNDLDEPAILRLLTEQLMDERYGLRSAPADRRLLIRRRPSWDVIKENEQDRHAFLEELLLYRVSVRCMTYDGTLRGPNWEDSKVAPLRSLTRDRASGKWMLL